MNREMNSEKATLAGIIGVLPSILALCLFPSSGFGNSYDDLVAEIEELEAKVVEFEASSGALLQLKGKVEELEAHREELKEEIADLEAGLEDREFLYQVYRDSYRVVAAPGSGTALGNVTLSDGRVLTNAVFVGTIRGGIQISASSGVVSLPVEQIPSTLGDKFNLPGNVPVVKSTLAGIRANRPTDLLTEPEAEAEEEGEAAAADAGSSSGSTREMSSVEKVRQSVEEREAEFKAMKARNDARWNRIAELKSEQMRNSSAITQARRDKKDAQREFDSRSIKADRNTIESTLRGFDQEVERLEERNLEIERESRELRTAIE